jgi:hypothetical protein
MTASGAPFNGANDNPPAGTVEQALKNSKRQVNEAK